MPDQESSADRLTRLTPIREALTAAGDSGVVVRTATPLRDVAFAAESSPAVRVVSVTDDDGRLVGIIRTRALCDDLFVSVSPEDFISDILRPGRLEEYGRLAHSRTAGDLMEEPLSVMLDESLGAAFRMLYEHNLEGLPVVDDDRHPVAYLDRLRLIAVWLKTHGA